MVRDLHGHRAGPPRIGGSLLARGSIHPGLRNLHAGCTRRVTTWNKGAEKIKGYTAEEVIGRHTSFCSTPECLAAGKPAQELATAAREGRWQEGNLAVAQERRTLLGRRTPRSPPRRGRPTHCLRQIRPRPFRPQTPRRRTRPFMSHLIKPFLPEGVGGAPASGAGRADGGLRDGPPLEGWAPSRPYFGLEAAPRGHPLGDATEGIPPGSWRLLPASRA